MMSSLDSHPLNGGSPDSARPPMMKQMKVNGISDCSPPMALISEPAAMNSSALKKPWVMRWNRPAEYAPTDTPMIM